jgi:hypothetical protein
VKTIWKFKLDPDEKEQTIEMPRGARIKSLLFRLGAPCLYAEVETEAPREPRTFELVETNEELCARPDKRRIFIGTHLLLSHYVLHVYEIVPY